MVREASPTAMMQQTTSGVILTSQFKGIMMSHMRTTLTVDDDLADRLAAVARDTGQPFKTVVNDAIRRGLIDLAPLEVPPFDYIPHAGGLRAGIDPRSFNALAGQLDDEDFAEGHQRGR